MTNIKKLVAAGALAGFLGIGGMSLASAQDAPTTTAPTEATSEAPEVHERSDEKCPNMGEEDGSTTDSTTAEGSESDTTSDTSGL